MIDRNLGNTAEKALDLHIVVHLEGLESQQDDSAGEILDGSAHRHADGHAAGSQQGGDGGSVDAQCADHRENQHDPKKGGHQALDESGQRGIGFLLLETFGNDCLGLPDEPGADDIDQEGEQDLETEFDDGGQGVLKQFIRRCRADGLHNLGPLCYQGIRRESRRGRGLEQS